MIDYDDNAIEIARAAAAADGPETLEALNGYLGRVQKDSGQARIDGAVPDILLVMLEIGRHAWDYVKENPSGAIEIGAAAIKVVAMLGRRGDLSADEIKATSEAGIGKAKEIAARSGKTPD